MKTEIKKVESLTSVNILRRGFDNYIPAQQICEFMNIDFEEVSKNPTDDLVIMSLEVIQEDSTEITMMCIHFESIERYLSVLNEKFNASSLLMTKFLIGLHKYHLTFEKDLESFLDEAYR